MREIKFRAWDKLLKKMIYDIRYHNNYRVNSDNEELFVIMQFTGFKDKNGKEIFEGDIVEKKLIKNNRIYTVMSFKPFVVEWKRCGFNLGFMDKHTCEVIGNIYENPELMKDNGGFLFKSGSSIPNIPLKEGSIIEPFKDVMKK